MSVDVNGVMIHENLIGKLKYDEIDSHLLTGRSWRLSSEGYAISAKYEPRDKSKPMTHGNRIHRLISMHRIIIGASVEQECDHINGDRLDNRRSNLRIVNSGQNKMNSAIRCDNTSGVKGVDFDKSRGKWRAKIGKDGLKITIGRFKYKEDAIKARKEAESKLHGEFSRRSQ